MDLYDHHIHAMTACGQTTTIVRLDDDVLRLVEQAAAQAGLDVSQFIQEAVVARLLSIDSDAEALASGPVGELVRGSVRETRAESRALVAESQQAQRRAWALQTRAAAVTESALAARFDIVFRATASSDGISLLDLGGNQEVELGTWLDLHVHSGDRAAVGAAIREAIMTRNVLEIEHRGVRADGSTGWFRTRGVRVSCGDGKISEWLVACGDVTDLVRRRTATAERQRA